MSISKNLKKILLVSASALLLASAGATSMQANANASHRRGTRMYRMININNSISSPKRHAHKVHKARHARKSHRRYTRRRKSTRRRKRRVVHHKKATKKAKRNAPKRAKKSTNHTLSDSQQAKAAIQQINNYRTQNGKAPLTENATLDKIAQIHSNNTANGSYNFGHKDPNGINYYSDISQKLGYGYINKKLGENMGKGFKSSQAANYHMMFNDGKHNWGHKDNILSSDYTQVGTGYKNGILTEDFEPSWFNINQNNN